MYTVCLDTVVPVAVSQLGGCAPQAALTISTTYRPSFGIDAKEFANSYNNAKRNQEHHITEWIVSCDGM
ncbi:hypothetical protein TNCV_3897871 [Trichonephila clavipes]|nr:hypothetical protein TNCV_3897871 [Trichonephila clavipes]